MSTDAGAPEPFAFEDIEDEQLLRGIYQYGFDSPSPIQQQSIPVLQAGASIVAQAHAGSGKTACFGIAALSLIDRRSDMCQAVFVSPSRELCDQTFGVVEALAAFMGLVGVNLNGGKSYIADIAALRKGGVHFVSTTPARLRSLGGIISRRHVRIAVFDECDKLFDPENVFLEHIQAFLALLDRGRTALAAFSATIPAAPLRVMRACIPDCREIILPRTRVSAKYIDHFYVKAVAFDEAEVDVAALYAQAMRAAEHARALRRGPDGPAPASAGAGVDADADDGAAEPSRKRARRRRGGFGYIDRAAEGVEAREDPAAVAAEKHRLLLAVYDSLPVLQSIVFCNSKERADDVHARLRASRFECERLHGGVSADERERVMERFRAGKFRTLVATDVLSRGIDVRQTSLVVHFDAPRSAEAYLHRSARSGRYGRKGTAISLVTAPEYALLRTFCADLGIPVQPIAAAQQ